MFFHDYACGVNWDGLAYCEASNVPTTVDTSGTYRGMFQFDVPTWRSVGGTGDPAKAGPAEQLRRAKLLYLDRGLQPWACAHAGLWPADRAIPGR